MTNKSPIQFDELSKKVITLLESTSDIGKELSDLRKYFASDSLNGELFLLQVGTKYRRDLCKSRNYHKDQESIIGYIDNAIDDNKEFINNSLIYMEGSSAYAHLTGLLFPVQAYAQSNDKAITYFNKRLAIYSIRDRRFLSEEHHYSTESSTSIYNKTMGVDTPISGDILDLFVGKNTIYTYLESMPKESQIPFTAAYSILPKKEKLPAKFIEDVFLKHFFNEERIEFCPEKDGEGNILESPAHLYALIYIYKQKITAKISGGITVNVSEFIDREMKKSEYDKLSKKLKS